MIKHIAWDYSVIDKVFGKDENQKTTKTLCERRVSMNLINSDKPTCPDCIRIEIEWLELAEQLEKEKQS